MATTAQRTRKLKVLYVQTLIDQAMVMIQDGVPDREAADTVLEGVELDNLLITDMDEATRLFRDGFLHRLNYLDRPASRRWYTPGEPVISQGEQSVTVRYEDREEQEPLRIQLTFLESRYDVASGNKTVRHMVEEDLIEQGERMIRQGKGSIRKGTVLSVDAPRALKKHKVKTPEELPERVITELGATFIGLEGEE